MHLVTLTYLLSCTVSEIQHSKGEKSLYFATPFAFKSPYGGVPLGRSPKIFSECQRMAKVPDDKEKLPKISTG